MKIHFSQKAIKEYKKLPKSYCNLVDKTFQKLLNNEIVDIIPVEGSENVFRIRVGRYRIIVEKFENDFLVASIQTRGDVYK